MNDDAFFQLDTESQIYVVDEIVNKYQSKYENENKIESNIESNKSSHELVKFILENDICVNLPKIF